MPGARGRKLPRVKTLASIALLALLAGCATNDEPAIAPSANAFNDCLRQEAIELPTDRPSARPSTRPSGGPPGASPGGGQGMQPPAGVDMQKWQQALQKCGSLRPSTGPGGDDGRASAYRNCLSERGVTFSPGQELSTADPKTAEAVKACEVLRPSPR